MTPEDWQRVWVVFAQASEVSPEERARLIEHELEEPELRAKAVELFEDLNSTEEASDEPRELPRVDWHWTGKQIGRFELGEPIGRGGVGEVYRAFDPELHREVAIKCIAPANLGSTNAVSDFLREARAASALNHPGIVTVFEIIRTNDAVAIVMELVDGSSLKRFTNHPQPLSSIAAWGRQIADALRATHTRGIIHLDIKPENLIVREDGHTKILDFGLAADRTMPPHLLPMGTVRYMSPEQGRAAELTTASDVFSLGLVLYELATGVHPFGGPEGRDSTMAITQTMSMQRARTPSSIVKALPREFDDLVMQMLAKDPATRPTAGEVASRLLKLTDRSQGQRARWIIAGSVLAVAGLAALWMFDRSEPKPPVSLKTEPFTSYQGWAADPALAPNGSRLAFRWTGPEDTNTSIYWKGMGEDAPHRLTSGPADDSEPAYSPDGKWIAFVRSTAGEPSLKVLVIPAGGGRERVVGDIGPAGFSRGLAWWPDGQSLLVRDSVDLNGVLARLYLSGRKVQYTFPTIADTDGNPEISPDGSQIAFVRYHAGSTELCLMGLEGGDIRCVARDQSIQGIAWQREGKFLYYAGISALWQAGLTNRSEDRAVKIADGIFASLTADLQGNLAFNRSISDPNIWSMGRHGENRRRLIASSGSDNEPGWSPDGSQILMRSDRSGTMELYTYRPDGSGARQITHFAAYLSSAQWSPDGAWIAFEGLRATVDPGNKFHNIYVVPSGGGVAHRVTNDRFNFEGPAWSPDSRTIYFLQDSESHVMQRTGFAGGSETGPAISIGEEMDDMVVSSDNQFFYYTRGAAAGIWRRPVAGGPETRISGTDGVHYRYWNLARQGLYFVDGPPNPTLKYLDFMRNRIETIAEFSAKSITARRGLAVSPDERTILYAQNDVALSNIYLITNLKD